LVSLQFVSGNYLWVGLAIVALPLVVVVSLINQQLWQDRGSNPLLSLALEARSSSIGDILLYGCDRCPII